MNHELLKMKAILASEITTQHRIAWRNTTLPTPTYIQEMYVILEMSIGT